MAVNIRLCAKEEVRCVFWDSVTVLVIPRKFRKTPVPGVKSMASIDNIIRTSPPSYATAMQSVYWVGEATATLQVSVETPGHVLDYCSCLIPFTPVNTSATLTLYDEIALQSGQ